MEVKNNIIPFFKTKSKIKENEYIDKNTFVELVQINKVALYRMARGIVQNEHDIEDAMSSAILNAYKNIKQLKHKESFKSWIMKILINECYSIIRKKKKVELQQHMEILNLSNEDKYENELMNSIIKLDKDYRTVLIQFYYEDMSIKEISKSISVSEGTVKSRLSRARTKLKNILESEAYLYG